MNKKTIGIIGAGNIGSALSKKLVEIGHTVRVANSRTADSLKEFVENTGAEAFDLNEVAKGIEMLFIAIPLKNIPNLHQVVNCLSEKCITVDICNYIPQRDGQIVEIDNGMASSEWVSGKLGIPVVKVFNNIIASRIVTQSKPKGNSKRVALPVSGNDTKSKQIIMDLVEELGFSAYDAGLLQESWRQQPGQPAYCTDPGIKELPKLLKRADGQRAVKKQAEGMKTIAKLPLDFPTDDLVRVSRLSNGLDLLKVKNWLAMLRLIMAMR